MKNMESRVKEIKAIALKEILRKKNQNGLKSFLIFKLGTLFGKNHSVHQKKVFDPKNQIPCSG